VTPTERIVKMAHERREFLQDVDGFYYYWPSNSGAFAPYVLRALADELDRLNGPWEGVIANAPELGGPQPGANA
jgi:hypothetical protein